MAEFNVEKSIMERYDIRLKGEDSWRCSWAVISISDDGFFNVQSDCGDFSYRWGSFGDCFKSFLIGILNDSGYLYSKICDNDKDNEIDMEKTIINMKKRIILNRQEVGNMTPYLDDELSPEEARELWDELDMVNNSYGTVSQDAFASIFYYELPSKERDKAFGEFWHDDILEYSSDRSAETFCEVVAPVFKEILKVELKNKKVS